MELFEFLDAILFWKVSFRMRRHPGAIRFLTKSLRPSARVAVKTDKATMTVALTGKCEILGTLHP